MSGLWIKRGGLVGVILPVVAASLLGVILFLGVSWQMGGIGFPLDDAWIHQTYARNLAQTGEWVYFPGKLSAGSTSPLWSAWLALGYLPGLAPYVWTFFSGWLGLVGVGVFGETIYRLQKPTDYPKFPWVGVFLALEWHLVWAAASGMETILYSMGILTVFSLILREKVNWFLVGLGIGIGVWLRPDGVTLLGPVLFCLVLEKNTLQAKFKECLSLAVGFAILVVLYFLFQTWVGGSWMPNTFFAKQAEYAELLNTPFFLRLFQLLALPLIGAGILLLPGFCFLMWKSFTQRRWASLAAGIWWLGYVGMYALRLPVTYQHGRYLIPAMPVYFILGCAGLADLVKTHLQNHRGKWIFGKTWLVSLAAVELAFLFAGASAYGTDVRIIETEMVETAHWIADNIEPGSKVAAHDIGALGYFSEYELIDLAGLVSPDVIPFIRDEEQLANYLDQQGVEYLVTFPGWYPLLIKKGDLVYQTVGETAPAAGGENMAVFKWNKGKPLK